MAKLEQSLKIGETIQAALEVEKVGYTHVMDDVASTSTICGGRRGVHQYSVWWMMWRAPVPCVVDDVASTGTLCGG